MANNSLNLILLIPYHLDWWRLLSWSIVPRIPEKIFMKNWVNLLQSSTVGEIQFVSSWSHTLNNKKKVPQSDLVASLETLTTDSWFSIVPFIPRHSAPPCDAWKQTTFGPFKHTTTAYVQAFKWPAYPWLPQIPHPRPYQACPLASWLTTHIEQQQVRVQYYFMYHCWGPTQS